MRVLWVLSWGAVARTLEAPRAGEVEGPVVGADVGEALVQVAETSPFVPAVGASVESRTTALSGGAWCVQWACEAFVAHNTMALLAGHGHGLITQAHDGVPLLAGMHSHCLHANGLWGPWRQRVGDVCPPLGWRRQPSTVVRAINSLLADKGRRQLHDLLGSHDEAGGLRPLLYCC